MAEELKACHYWREDRITGRLVVITPDEYEQWGKDNQPSEAYRPAFTRAQLPSQGGEAVAWAICKEPGRVDWLSATYANKRAAEEHVASYKDGLTLYITPLYTHPADQVAEGVVVPRELLKTVLDPVCTDDWAPACKQLRALLNGGRS